MKRILILILTAIMMVGAASSVNAENKLLRRAQKKEYKTKMKQLKKEGWTLYGSSHSLDVALLSHYDKLESLAEKGYELMGEATKFQSKNVGKQTAINNACNIYAREAGSYVKGRIVSDLAGNADDVSAEFDHFYAAYETLVEKEIKGELKESFSIIHDNGDGTFSMQVYFIVDEDGATQARIRAFENAMRESEAAQKYAERVSDFIKEGFIPENNQ